MRKIIPFIQKIFLALLLISSLDAGDIVTQYRLHGIDNIQKELDLELANKEYWTNYIKDKDTTFGYIESYNSVLTCNKEKNSLNLYKKDQNLSFTFQKDYDAFTGKLKGDKEKEGDLRTPVGIYDLVKRIDKVDSFYGPLALVTSYPNIYDTYRGKNGYGIWIHGLPIEQERDDFTKGCIAINNGHIECLNRRINVDDTLLIINEHEVQKNVSKEKLAILLAGLYQWRFAWIYNDLEQYLAFYSPEFVRVDKMNYERFKEYKTRVFSKNEEKTIIFTDLNVIPYPNTKDIFQITFNEFYKSPSFEFKGDKVLIVKLGPLNKIEILTEK
jgi:murein L,D-transpeptidase YafK